MDVLLSSPPHLSCGVDSGEYVFLNKKAYLNQLNESEGQFRGNLGSLNLLADYVQKFIEIYEKVENGKRQQMVELEKMWMEFYKDLEFQRREILERVQAETDKTRQCDDDHHDHYKNING
ncbi:hypothetical protein ACS0TY_020758 [Phlomoides rotata]